MKILTIALFITAFAAASYWSSAVAAPAPVVETGHARSSAARPTAPTDAELRAAAGRAIDLMQRSQATWSKAQACASCHHVLIPQVTLELARTRGLHVDESIARDVDHKALDYLADVDNSIQHLDYVDVFFDSWLLVGGHAAGLKPNVATAAYASFVASMQLEDGSWRSTDGRPPQAFDAISATAMGARAIQLYLPRERERAERTARARAFLVSARPEDSTGRAYRLIGLTWTGASPALRAAAARELLAEQHADGGWSELPWRPNDAYATGLALYALASTDALSVRDPEYVRGLRWLVAAQQADGSWHVASRLHPPAPVSPPYFETGFPYGHDQFVSMMATTWSAAAMLEALPAARLQAPPTGSLAGVAATESSAWLDAIVAGSTADLARMLAKGLDPNAATRAGTTALMAAAGDLEKVKLLVARGADVNAAASSGVTPLIVASHFHGNVETVRFLLDRGARPNPGHAVRYDASAVYLAMFARDPQIIDLLLDRGAPRDIRMKVLGILPIDALVFAASTGDAPVVKCLLEHGVDPNALDDSGISPLAWAAIYGRPEAADVLLTHGANVNFVDGLAMTPAMYAASFDYGDTATLRRLIAAGADLGVRDRAGQRAVDLARGYGHSLLTSVLVAQTASR